MSWAGSFTRLQPVVVILGPTAIGKTGTAIQLGQRLNAEIIGADSRQIYKYMDIGTAKPTPAEQAALPHHMIDVVEPDIRYNVAQFTEAALGIIHKLHLQDKLPMVVGGTGQYITALIQGWQIPEVPPNPALRAELEEYAERYGWQGLLERLRAVDPHHAEVVDPKNLRRVIRAIEVSVMTGQTYSSFRVKQSPSYNVLEIGLDLERATLYDRADQRVDAMLEAGLVAEVEDLVRRGYDWHLPAMSSLGYLQIGQYLRGDISLAEASQQIKHATHHFIRRQYTWFRKYNPATQWFIALPGCASQILPIIQGWLSRLHHKTTG
jgi:tRNA dimethylallyltransferase